MSIPLHHHQITTLNYHIMSTPLEMVLEETFPLNCLNSLGMAAASLLASGMDVKPIQPRYDVVTSLSPVSCLNWLAIAAATSSASGMEV
jgi:hypothetical protein